MADTLEIPEANDPFEKRVAITIAILAAALALIGNRGDNAKTDAIIKTNEATDQWGYFQARSLKAELVTMHADLLTHLPAADDAAGSAAKLKAKAAGYEKEKEEIKAEADKLQLEARQQTKVNDRCDSSSLFLQIGIVICSVAILARSHKFWWAGVLLGVAGIAFGSTAFFM